MNLTSPLDILSRTHEISDDLSSPSSICSQPTQKKSSALYQEETSKTSLDLLILSQIHSPLLSSTQTFYKTKNVRPQSLQDLFECHPPDSPEFFCKITEEDSSYHSSMSYLQKTEVDEEEKDKIKITTSSKKNPKAFLLDSIHQIAENMEIEEQNYKKKNDEKTLLLLQEVNELKRNFENRVCIKYESEQKHILSALEYVGVNTDNFLAILRASEQFSREQISLAEQYLKATEVNIKLTDNIIPSIFNIAKLFVIAKDEKKLYELKDRYFQFQRYYQEHEGTARESDIMNLIAIEKSIQEIEIGIYKVKRKAIIKTPLKIFKLFTLVANNALAKFAEIPKASVFLKSLFIIFKNIYTGIFLSVIFPQEEEWYYLLQPLQIDINNNESSDLIIKQEAREFIDALRQCRDFSEVRSKFAESKIPPIEIPTSWEEWKQQIQNNWRFVRQLGKIFIYHRGKPLVMKSKQIQSNLHYQQREHARKIEFALPIILKLIRDCKTFDIQEITHRFKLLHIDLSQIRMIDPMHSTTQQCFSISSLQEWENAIQNPEFCRALTSQWVDYQETSGKLILQSLRQALLSKHDIERKFLFFRAIKSIVDISFNVIQLTCCLPKVQQWEKTVAFIGLFLLDLTKLNIPFVGFIHLFHPIFPDVNFRLNSLLMIFIEGIFAAPYKPNEYSKKGYELAIEERKINFLGMLHLFLTYLEKTTLWFKIQLIEKPLNFFQQKPIFDDHRFEEIDIKYKKTCEEYKQHLIKVKNLINQLKINDIKNVIDPSYHQDKLQGKKPIDPLDTITKTLEELDFSYLTPDIPDFVAENFGIQLKEENKLKLREELEKVLTREGTEFVSKYRRERNRA